MGLSVLKDSQGSIASASLFRAVADRLSQHRPVTVLVPGAVAALEVRRALADAGVGLGVDVTTPQAWATSLWERLGDGSRVAAVTETRAVAWDVLRRMGGPAHLGTGALAASLATKASALLDPEAPGLSPEQREAVLQALQVAEGLHEHGLLTLSDVFARLPGVLAEAGQEHVIAAGFWRADATLVDLLAHVACSVELTYALSAPEGPAGEAPRLVAELVAEKVRLSGGSVRQAVESGGGAALRAPALQQVLDEAFRGHGARAEDSVRLLEAAGPEAEAELVAREAQGLADAGAEHVVVVTRDPERAWRELSPKLSARGMQVRARWSRRALESRQVRLFLGFACQTVQLAQAERSWAQERLWARGGGPPSRATLQERLDRAMAWSVRADRSWWPPRALVDYLLAGPWDLNQRDVFLLDARWRSDRTLTPGAVVRQLKEAAGPESPLPECLDLLAQGELGRAAELLLPLAVKRCDREAHQALVAVVTAALEAQALLPWDGLAPEDRLEVVEWMLDAQAQRCAPERGRLGDTCRCVVELLGPQDAAVLALGSRDALVVLGQTSTEDPIVTSRGAMAALLRVQGLGPQVPEDVVARAQAWRLWSVPSHWLVLERALNDENAAPLQPSWLWKELLACLAEDPAVARRGEERISQNLAPGGFAPETVQEVPLAEEGLILPRHAASVLARPDLEDLSMEGAAGSGATAASGASSGASSALPIVSPTAIESYLECPRRWFYEKALRPVELDARVTPLSRGNLVHRTLEEAYRARRDGGPGLSAASVRPLLEETFDRVVLEGINGVDKVGKAMAPHSLAEEQGLRQMRRDLDALGAFQDERFRGFRPRLLEQPFGLETQEVRYGGARLVGVLDRVDVDANGNALVIDYKNKQNPTTFSEYGLPADISALEEWRPRHPQAFIYARVLQHLVPGLNPVGALYLMTGSNQDLRGVVDPRFAQTVFGAQAPKRPGPEALGATFHEMVDRVEEVVAEAVRGMVAGNVEPRPCDPRLCEHCPVVSCERRREAR